MSKRPTNTTRLVLVVAIVIASFAVASQAIGHVKVASTAPAKGSTVKAPRSASFTLTGPAKSGKLSVKGPGGKLASVGAGARDPRNVKRILVSLKSGLAKGKYTASGSWIAADGHRQTTSFTFNITK